MLVKKLVDWYHADIELTDTGADGTVFTVTFPCPSDQAPTMPSSLVDDAVTQEADSAPDQPGSSLLSPVSDD